MDTRDLTYGEIAVGITFNPSENPKVAKLKRLAADLIDEIDQQRNGASGEAVAQYTLAIRRIQEGQMWSTKAVFTK